MELELVSIAELARRRGVSKATLARRIKKGLLPEDAFIHLEGETHPLIDFEVAMKYMDALTDAQKSQVEKVKRNKSSKSITIKEETRQNNDAKEGNKQSNPGVPGKKENVKSGEANQKPKEETNKPKSHADQIREKKMAGLVLDEKSGLYFADDVEIEDFDGKRLVKAKDVLLSNAERYQKNRALTEAIKAEQMQMKLDVDKGNLIDGEKLKAHVIKIGTETRDAIQNIPEQYGPDLLACKDLIELQTTLAHAINKALENLKRLKK